MFIAYIALTQSPYFSVSSIQGILQILQEVPSFPSSSLLSSFDNSVKLLHYRGRPGCCSSRCISSLITVPDSIFFPFPFFPTPAFSALFCYNKFVSVLFIQTFVISREVVLGSLLKTYLHAQNFFSIQWVIVTASKGLQ